MPYLLDADWIIDGIAKRRNVHTILEQLIPEGIAVSIITLGEVYERSFRSSNPEAYLKKLRDFLSRCSIINLNDSLMAEFAEVRAMLRRQGKLIPDFDLLIGITESSLSGVIE